MSNFGPLPYEEPMIGRGNYGPLGDSTNGGSMASVWRFYAGYDGTGRVYEELPSTDLHLVVDDAGGSNWSSRVGPFIASRNGNPTVGLETPLYSALNSTFNGVGFRTAMQCGPIDYYSLPHNSAHDLTSASATTYDISFISGDFANNEIIISNDSSTDYNFYLASLLILGTPYIEVRVRHSVADAYVQFQCSRFSLYRLKITYLGANKILTLASNGYDIGTSIGVGTPNTGGTQGLFIGKGVGGLPALTTKIIEIQRHQSILPTSPDWRRLCYRSWNVHDVHDFQPAQLYRNTKAGLNVNNKFWQVGENWPRIDKYGYDSEEVVVNSLQNSTFTEAFNTGWTALGIGNMSYQADVEDNSTVGGTGLKFQNDIIGTDVHANWLGAFINANTPCFFTCEWKSLTANAQAYFLIFSFGTGNYYDALAQVWQPFPVFNIPNGISLTKQKYDLLFISDVVAGNVSVFIGNSPTDLNTESFSFFHAQLTDNVDSPTSSFVYENISGGNFKASDILQYNQLQAIDYTKGEVRVDFTPRRNSNQNLSLHDESILGGLTEFLFVENLSTGFGMTDGLNTCTIYPTYSNNQTLKFQALWGANLTIKETTSNLSATSVFFPPLNVGDLAVGGRLFTTFQPYSRIKHLRIK